jgi:cell division cycle 20-like protein 1 (cofactor of APC complex)
MLQTYDDLVSYRTKVMAGDEWYSSTRKISKIPFKVLDAPSLQDDFYLNLIDWSSSNILAVALA